MEAYSCWSDKSKRVVSARTGDEGKAVEPAALLSERSHASAFYLNLSMPARRFRERFPFERSICPRLLGNKGAHPNVHESTRVV